uniref:Peptidase A2 domain-containing protein n=1 Tax=Salarias fasciatus TaxID=181472 RepID=A0A672HQ96_SALFA
MAHSLNPQLLAELLKWCADAKVDPANALILSNVPTETTVADITESLEAVKVLGRVRYNSKKLVSQLQQDMILCECQNPVDPKTVPPEIHPLNGETSWKVTLLTPATAPPEDFTLKLMNLLQSEGKSLNDLQPLLEQSTPAQSDPASIIRAVGELLEKTMRPPPENNTFRRLRVFSGVMPTPAGEETLENWLEQAQLMLDECEVSAREKKKRIVESVKGPAFEIIQAVRCNDADARPEDYLAALENAFGTTRSGEDFYFAFRSMQQKSGERLSDYLRRLEKALSKAVQKGGLPHTSRDRARVEQLLRGAASESDILLLQLRLKERLRNPPSFMELLSEIRIEEDQKATRRNLTTSAHTVRTTDDNTAHSAELDILRSQVKTLEAKVQHEPAAIPLGLVGESSMGKVMIEGQACDALMDGGSNVSIVFEDY